MKKETQFKVLLKRNGLVSEMVFAITCIHFKYLNLFYKYHPLITNMFLLKQRVVQKSRK